MNLVPVPTSLLCLGPTALALPEISPALWLSFYFFSPLLHACSDVAPAEVFQRGQIVPEAASGTMTTTGQVCQPNKPSLPLPGAMMQACAHTHARPHTRSRKHTDGTETPSEAKNDTAKPDNTQLAQRGREDTPPDGGVTCSSVSLRVQYKPRMHVEIIKSLISTRWESNRGMTVDSVTQRSVQIYKFMWVVT